MTKEDEIPDWAGAQDFYQKYDPKEILGRYCTELLFYLGTEMPRQSFSCHFFTLISISLKKKKRFNVEFFFFFRFA